MFENRVARYLDAMAKAESAEELTPAQKAVASKVATLLTKAIRRRWKGTDGALAARIDIDPSKLSVLKNHGTHKALPSLTAICQELSIDADRLLEGKLVAVPRPTRRPDLHSMLDALVGTPDEPAVEQVLKAFVKASKH